MLAGGIDVLVAQYVRHQIDIPGFPVQIGAKGAAQLVGGDVLEGTFSN